MTTKSTPRYSALASVVFASMLGMGCNAALGFGEPIYEDKEDVRGVLTAERTQICRKSAAKGRDGPCLPVEGSDEDSSGKVVTTGVVTGTFVLGDEALSSQTNGDMFVARFNADATLDWSVTFTAYTAYSAAHADDFEDTFGNGTSTSGRAVIVRSDKTIAVAGDYATGEGQICFLARFKDSNTPPSIQFFDTDSDCTAGAFIDGSDGAAFKATVAGPTSEQTLTLP